MLIYIIIGIILLAVAGAILEWIGDHKGLVAAIVAGGICIVLFGLAATLIIAAAIFILIVIAGVIANWMKNRNEKSLNKYLEQNCMRCGYMTEKSWKASLPQFVSKSYATSFGSITNNFAKRIEKQYIEGDAKLTWLDPAVRYLIYNLIADIYELERVPSENLNYTHTTPNGKLIYDAMEYLCKAKVSEGKHMIQKIPLEDDAVRKELKLPANKGFPEYYKAAYKINDYFADKRKSDLESNMETEEISLEDL